MLSPTLITSSLQVDFSDLEGIDTLRWEASLPLQTSPFPYTVITLLTSLGTHHTSIRQKFTLTSLL